MNAQMTAPPIEPSVAGRTDPVDLPADYHIIEAFEKSPWHGNQPHTRKWHGERSGQHLPRHPHGLKGQVSADSAGRKFKKDVRDKRKNAESD